MDEMLTVLQKEIKIRESKPQISQEVNKPARRDRQVTTGSALVGNKSTRGECPYCLGHHKAEDCTKITGIAERKKLLKRYMRCFSCLKRGHRIIDCNKKESCTTCGDTHHISICDGKKEVQESTIPSLHAQSKGAMALETLQAFVTGKDGNQAVRCRLLLDTGSQFTFITKELANMLGVEPTKTEQINLSGIGKSEGVSTTGSVYEVSIEGLDRKRTISTEVHTLPEISRISNVKPHVQKEKYGHLKDLWFPDVSEKSELEIHVLIGVQDYHRIVTGGLRRGESQSDPVAIETIFGWTLSGKVNHVKVDNSNVNVNLAIDGKKSKDQLWWQGPDWIRESKDNWPENIASKKTTESEKEEKKAVTLTTVNDTEQEVGIEQIIDISKYSSESKVYRITSWVLRFIRNCRKKVKIVENIQIEEIQEARKYWIKSAQADLKKHPRFSHIAQSLGVKEVDGIMRCHGRLNQAELREETKTPILLPKYHPLTHLVIRSCHARVFHSGENQTLSELRQTYWVAKGRQEVKKVIRNCTKCLKVKGKPFSTPTVGDIPSARVTRARPFERVGIDFAGPLFVRSEKGAMQKAYVMLISCAVTRGVYLALMKETTSDALKMELRKFIARRGAKSVIISDNAQSFRKTAKWVKKIVKKEDLQELLRKHEVQWKFNIPLSPWWGGFYERMVAIVKSSLKKTLGNARLKFKELEVILTEIEASINNRPITYQGDDVETVLTPSHLINGDVLPQIAEELTDTFEEDSNVQRRYRYMCRKRHDIWKRWNHDYLVGLRQYHRMSANKGREIEKGEVVMMSSNDHRSRWKLGVIETLIKSHDGIIKGACVRVIVNGKPKIMERSVQLLYPLEIRAEVDVLTEESTEESIQSSDQREKRLTAVGARERIRDIMTEDQDD